MTACAFPTDRSDALRVEIATDAMVILIGDTARVSAGVVTPDRPLPNATVTYDALDSNVAVVSSNGLVLGVGEGQTQIVARAPGLQFAATDSVDVLVSRGIVIVAMESEVTAGTDRASFGEIIELTGLRLAPESLSVVTIGAVPAPIVGYDARDTSDVTSFEHLRIRVPVVPPTSELLLVHRGGGTAARTLQIIQEDVFETLGILPVIDLRDGDYLNDALTASAGDPDLIRFVLPAGDFTLTATILGGRALVQGEPELKFLAPQVSQYAEQFEDWYNPSEAPDRWAWSVENRGISCDLRTLTYYPTGPFNAARGPGNVVTLALENARADTVDFIAATVGERIQYRLEARAGYNAALPPDALEENDACPDAVSFSLSDAAIDLNFDNPTDFDWFAVTIAEGTPAPSFDVTQRSEQEPNDTFATAEVVTFGTRVVGLRDVEGDVDVYAFDAVAGTLLDVDVHARDGALQYGKLDCPDRCSPGLPPYAPPGSSLITDLLMVARLHDSTGMEIARDSSPLWGNFLNTLSRDARIRHLVPTTGRYYISVDGVGVSIREPGIEQYYAIDFFAHDVVSELRIDVESGDGLVDPKMVVVERRSDENVILDVADQPGLLETYTRPVHAGSYFVLVFESSGLTGPYRLRVQEVPLGAPVAGRHP